MGIWSLPDQTIQYKSDGGNADGGWRGGWHGAVDMEVDKVANMMVKIPNEDFTDVTLAIGDTYGDDGRGAHWGGGNGG